MYNIQEKIRIAGNFEEKELLFFAVPIPIVLQNMFNLTKKELLLERPNIVKSPIQEDDLQFE